MRLSCQFSSIFVSFVHLDCIPLLSYCYLGTNLCIVIESTPVQMASEPTVMSADAQEITHKVMCSNKMDM